MVQSAVEKSLKGLIAAGVSFLLTIAVMGFLSYKLSDLDYWTIHTHKVIEELKDSLASLQDVETGERGYLVTSVPEFLEPFRWGMQSVKGHIDRVRSLTEDNPEEQIAVKRLSDLAQQKMDLAQTSVKDSPLNNKVSIVSAQREGKKIMDAYRDQVKVMIGHEDRLLGERTSGLRFFQNAVWIATFGLALLAVMLLYWVFRITQAAINDEKQRVAELNTEIEQRKRIETALKQTTINLSRSNADLQQFAYVASHDLQEPLRAVTGFLTLLSSKQVGKLDTDSQKYITHAVEGAHRMRALINDLLTYARVESRAKEFEKVQLSKVLERVTTDLAVQIGENGAEITYDELPTVWGDAIQLGQLFQNLLGNAIKFRSSAAPVVKIECAPQNGEYLFSIQDNGRGFDMEHAERIFIIFQRLQGREQASGTGIGLALCKKIVERHSGKIWVESKPEHGSTFFFTIHQGQPVG
jgi:signal transduction histidine kinase